MPYSASVALKKDLSLFPLRIDEWTGSKMSEQIENLPPHTDQYLYRKYINNKGISLFLYIGYWGKFRHNSNVFSGSHLSPGYKWDLISEEQELIKLGGKNISIKRAIFAKDDYKISLLYCYYIDHKITTKRFKGRIINGINAIFNRKTNIALIKIYSQPYIEDEELEQIIKSQIEFSTKIFPLLVQFFP